MVSALDAVPRDARRTPRLGTMGFQKPQRAIRFVADGQSICSICSAAEGRKQHHAKMHARVDCRQAHHIHPMSGPLALASPQRRVRRTCK